MKYAPSSVSLSIMIASLLAGTALVKPQAVSAASADLQAQTGWAITRVASMSQGAYCTMAQKFSNDTVLTIAKNNGGEYSLAFDFQSPKFQVGKALTASVKAGNGSTQTFEVEPTSPQAIVIGLGSDEKFISAVQSSGKLQLDVGGDSFAFNTVKFKEAQDEMATCMSSMKPDAREAKNTNKASGPSDAQIAEAAEARKNAQVAPAAVAPSDKQLAAAPKTAQLSAEDLTAAPIEPLPAATKIASATATAAPAPVAPVSAPKVAPAVVASASAGEDSLVAENKKLKQSLEESRRSYENQMTSQQGARLPELQEKMRVLDMENAKLKDQLAKTTPAATNKDDLTRLATELDKAKQDLAKATEDNKALQSQVATAATVKGDAAKNTQIQQLSQRELDTLKAENQTLKNQLQIASKADAKAPAAAAQVDPALAQEVAYLRAENEKLVKTAAAKPADKNNAAGSIELQKRVSELQAENATLKNQLADGSQLTPLPAATIESPLSEADKENLRGQIRDLKSQLEIVESETAGLRKQLETAQREADGTQIKAAGGSWDLEQATRRYQESQREIRRLGGLLEEDRVKCTQEKKDIEYMLFDPEVAKPAQISMLNNLEDQVTAKDMRIAELENTLKTAGLQPASGDAKADIQTAAPLKRVASEDLLKAETTAVASVVPDLPVPATMAAPVPQPTRIPLQAAPAPLQPVPAPTVRPFAETPTAIPLPMPTPAAIVAPVSPMAAPQPVAVASAKGFQTSQDFAGLLKSAGVTLRGTVQPVQKVSSDTYKAYSWQTDSLYGSAEQRSMSGEGNFEPAVKQYIDRAKSRCAGDFAAVPAQISGTIPAEGYEIACVTGQTGSSASVLFTYKDGVMTTVAHEGRAEAMDIAMDARDRVASKLAVN